MNIRELESRRQATRRFWQDLVSKKSSPDHARIGGQHYVICSEFMPAGSMRGHSGRKFKIKFFDGREVETTNLWGQGDIPADFRDDLPDNARFVDD